jgi:hypothetical protein
MDTPLKLAIKWIIKINIVALELRRRVGEAGSNDTRRGRSACFF